MDEPEFNPVMRRMWTQGVARPVDSSAAAAVARMVAVQAQEFGLTRWSLGMRVKGLSDADVLAAFDRGEILRTHMLRPTWHFAAPEDIGWLLRLTGPRVHVANRFMYKQEGLDEPLLAKAHGVIAEALTGGRALTRKAIGELLAGAGIKAERFRLAYILMAAEVDGLVCSGPMEGKQHTYALLEERVPDGVDRGYVGDEALAQLAIRFFSGHGPASEADFHRWSGLTVRQARSGFETAKGSGALDPFERDGHEYLIAAGEDPWRGVPEGAFLIPEFDETLKAVEDMGLDDHPWVVDRDGWYPGFYRPIVVGGHRAGTWRRTVKGSRVLFETNLFARLASTEADLVEAEIARFGEFLGMPVEVKPHPGSEPLRR